MAFSILLRNALGYLRGSILLNSVSRVPGRHTFVCPAFRSLAFLSQANKDRPSSKVQHGDSPPPGPQIPSTSVFALTAVQGNLDFLSTFLKPTSASAYCLFHSCPQTPRCFQASNSVSGLWVCENNYLTAYSLQQKYLFILVPMGFESEPRRSGSFAAESRESAVKVSGDDRLLRDCRLPSKRVWLSAEPCSASRVSPRFLVRWSSLKMAAFFVEPGRKQASNFREDVSSARSPGRRLARLQPRTPSCLQWWETPWQRHRSAWIPDPMETENMFVL